MTYKLIYGTKTGHSRKIAKSVAQALGCEAIDVKTKPNLGEVDMLFIIGGIYGGQSNPDLLKFVQSLTKESIKRAALITSCASRKFFQKEIRATLVSQGIDVVTEEAVCWGSFLFSGWGHPNADDFETAITFVKKYL